MARIKTEAYVVSAPGAPFKLEQVELDELKGGEVLVKMKATGICHTGTDAPTDCPVSPCNSAPGRTLTDIV